MCFLIFTILSYPIASLAEAPIPVSLEESGAPLPKEPTNVGAVQEFLPNTKPEPVRISQNMKLILYGFVIMVLIGSFAAKKSDKEIQHHEDE